MKNLKETKIGIFKLKDKKGRNAIELDLGKIAKQFPDAKFLYIAKNYGENNKVTIFIKHKDVPEIPQVQFKKD